MNRCMMSAVQMNSGTDIDKNFDTLSCLIKEAVDRGADFVTTPECAVYCGGVQNPDDCVETAALADSFFSGIAAERGIWLHCGGVAMPGGTDGKLLNTALLYAPDGTLAAKYEKIHLFDAEPVQGSPVCESDKYSGGTRVTTVLTDWGTVGLSICYDVRFPELFRLMALRGAGIVIVSADFTMTTGRDHWEVLLRARAIENQCYIVAPAQIGRKQRFAAYGRSMIIDPWGTVLATCPDSEGVICAPVDAEVISRVRRILPCLQNRRPAVYRKAEERINLK